MMTENTDITQSQPSQESTAEPALVTEVTSIAKEDEKTGVKTNIPSPEELVSKAVVSIHRSRQGLMNILGGLSKKATMRVLNAIFELPQAKLPVTLRGDEEKLAFALGQRIQSDRFIIIQHYINKEIVARQQQTQEAPNEQQQG